MRTRILGRTLGALCVGAVLAGGTPPDAPVADAALPAGGTPADARADAALLAGGTPPDARVADAALPSGDVPPDAPVADAAMRGDVAEVRALLRQGADVNAAQGDGMTALHWAAESGALELARMLLYAGASPAARTRNGAYVPLHLASRAGHTPVVAALLDAGSDPDAPTSTGARPLHFATQAASVETVRTLLDRGAEIDARDHAHEQTPLMWAAAYGYADVVALLVERGADVDAASRAEDIAARADADEDERARRNARLDAMIAFERAAAEGRQVTPEDIGIARNFDEVQAASDTAAAEDEDEDEAEEEKKDEEEEPEPLGYHDLVGRKGGLTPLHFAVRAGHREAARTLLDAGADIDRPTDGDHSSPMLLATINGHFDLALELLERGADPDRASDAGATPLYAALNLQWHSKSIYPQPQAYKQETGYLDFMERLLEAGADPNVRLEKTLWYLEYNFSRLSVEFAGSTPFWRAAYAQDVDAMRLLVEHGADPTIPTKRMPERRRRRYDDDENQDKSGLPPVPLYGPDAQPIHAAAGIGFGEGYAGGFHRGAPDGWLPAVKYLVEELGADVNARDANGFSPLHHAAARGDVEVIRFLVEKGADVTLVSRRGKTTADMANSPVQRVPVYPEALALLESLGAVNNHDCQVC